MHPAPCWCLGTSPVSDTLKMRNNPTENNVSSCCRADHLTAFTFYGHVWFSPSLIPVKTLRCESVFRTFEFVAPYVCFWALLVEAEVRTLGSAQTDLKCTLSDRRTFRQVNHLKQKEKTKKRRPWQLDCVFLADFNGIFPRRRHRLHSFNHTIYIGWTILPLPCQFFLWQTLFSSSLMHTQAEAREMSSLMWSLWYFYDPTSQDATKQEGKRRFCAAFQSAATDNVWN